MVFALLIAALLGIDLDSESARLHLETGLAYMQQGLLEKAVEELETTLELDPDCHEAYLALGRLRAGMGDPGAAEENLQRFMEMRPEDWRGALALARLRLDTGASTEARDLALLAHALNPAEPEIWMELGEAAALCGDTASALDWLERVVLEEGPLENSARVRAASLLRATGRLSQARTLLLPAAEEEYPAAVWGLARVYTAWEDWMRASDAMRSYLRMEPSGRWADSARMELERFSEEGLYIPGSMP